MVRGLPVEDRGKIVAFRSKGESFREIATKIGCSPTAVMKTIKRFNEIGTLHDRPRPGRPCNLSESDVRYITLCSKRNRMKTVPVLTYEFNLTRKKRVSFSCVRRSLKKSRMVGRVAAKKPLLRPQNIKKRLEFAKNHVNWTKEQWRRVLFTDESKFEIFGAGKRRMYVRRMANERFKSYCLKPTVKHGGGSVMVWGGVCAVGVVPLVRIKGIMDQKVYHSILVRKALPGGLKLLGRGFVLQQDNDPKHTAKLNAKYLQTKAKTGQ